MNKPEFQNRSPVLAGLVWLFLACAMTPVHAQHIHVQLSYTAAQQWRLFIHDFDSGEFDPAVAPLRAGHPAFSFVPANAFTNFLGPAGSGVWTLPETEIADLLYLGIGTSGIAPGTFQNNQIRLELHHLTGPGYFALYNVDSIGSPIVHMNSRDGIDPALDALALSAVGGHVHVNWAFSAPGTYRVGLAASGRLAASGQTNTSPVVEYTFIVEDIPWRPALQVSRKPHGPDLELIVRGQSGRRYLVETSHDVQQWFLLTNFIATATETEVRLPAETNRSRLFRAHHLAP